MLLIIPFLGTSMICEAKSVLGISLDYLTLEPLEHPASFSLLLLLVALSPHRQLLPQLLHFLADELSEKIANKSKIGVGVRD